MIVFVGCRLSAVGCRLSAVGVLLIAIWKPQDKDFACEQALTVAVGRVLVNLLFASTISNEAIGIGEVIAGVIRYRLYFRYDLCSDAVLHDILPKRSPGIDARIRPD
jgi:hypothetical protein